MFATLFVKKRITHKVLAKQFVHKTLRAVDETFEDFFTFWISDDVKPPNFVIFLYFGRYSRLRQGWIFCHYSRENSRDFKRRHMALTASVIH